MHNEHTTTESLQWAAITEGLSWNNEPLIDRLYVSTSTSGSHPPNNTRQMIIIVNNDNHLPSIIITHSSHRGGGVHAIQLVHWVAC